MHTSNDNGIRSNLSLRQLRVAELAACGYSNREIASELKITEQIVKNVLHSVFDKLGVWNRVELANRFPRSVAPGITLESECRIKPEGLGQLLPHGTLDIQAGRAYEQPTTGAECGMELRDLLDDPEFRLRKKRPRQETYAAEAYRILARVFVDNPDAVLQCLVEAATAFCGADSAGVSLEETADGNGERRFRWIAIAGSFAPFLNGTTPRFFSPCGTTLDRKRAQLYRVRKPYYDYLGVKADPITDGILIPWQAGEMRGTLWVVSHRHRKAFDVEDFKLIDGLADFASIAVNTRFNHERMLVRDQKLTDLKAG